MFKVIFRDDAYTDIEDTVAYYQLIQSGLSEAFQEEIAGAIVKLETAPQSYSYLDAQAGIRFLRLKKFRFNLIFEITSEQVIVYGVRHTKRFPFI